VLFASVNTTKTYLCLPVLGGGPGGLYSIISLSFFVAYGVSGCWREEELDIDTPVAIQWHISLHSGLSREGASGSVRAIVYSREDDVRMDVLDVGSSCNSIFGVSCSSSGFMVLPNSALLLDGQEIFRISDGRKSLITVGIISAFFSSWRTSSTLLLSASPFRICWSVESA